MQVSRAFFRNNKTTFIPPILVLTCYHWIQLIRLTELSNRRPTPLEHTCTHIGREVCVRVCVYGGGGYGKSMRLYVKKKSDAIQLRSGPISSEKRLTCSFLPYNGQREKN